MAREAGIEAIRYRSVRDPQGRANLALLTCRAFASRAPLKRQSWRIRLTPGGALAVCEFPELRLAFYACRLCRRPAAGPDRRLTASDSQPLTTRGSGWREWPFLSSSETRKASSMAWSALSLGSQWVW